MKKLFFAAVAMCAVAASAHADLTIHVTDQPVDTSVVAQFRADYVAGSGLTYVRMPDQNGTPTVYRYGNASRSGVLSQTGDKLWLWLYTCGSQRKIVLPDDAAVVAVGKPEFIRRDDVGFQAAEEAYLEGCYNPISHAMTWLDHARE